MRTRKRSRGSGTQGMSPAARAERPVKKAAGKKAARKKAARKNATRKWKAVLGPGSGKRLSIENLLRCKICKQVHPLGSCPDD